MHDALAIRPRWIWSMAGEPCTGSWAIVRAGVIEELAPSCPVSIPASNQFDRPDWFLLPGFINSHCHLEFSDCENPFPASHSFAEWIGAVVKHRMNPSGDPEADRQAAIESGIVQAWELGTRFLLDTVTSPWRPEWIEAGIQAIQQRLTPQARIVSGEEPIRIRPCVEVLDINQTRKSETLSFFKSLLAQRNGVDLSPHAPYTASRRFVKEVVSLANQSNAIVSMHLAESHDEMDWLVKRQGAFETRLKPFRDAAFEEERTVLEDYLQTLLDAERVLIAHGNYLSDIDLRQIAEHSPHAAVVHCPRTYRHFQAEGRDSYPMMQRDSMGVQHFLGTDSLASNPDLSLWRELQCIMTDSPAETQVFEQYLRMITTQPALFFLQKDLGLIEPGRSALLNVLVKPHGWPEQIDQVLKELRNTTLHPRPLELVISQTVRVGPQKETVA
ncbi:amidohydrolase family protein [Pirellulaceae bacterium SH449]